jgi:hypothetical protein
LRCVSYRRKDSKDTKDRDAVTSTLYGKWWRWWWWRRRRRWWWWRRRRIMSSSTAECGIEPVDDLNPKP